MMFFMVVSVNRKRKGNFDKAIWAVCLIFYT
jgi:hypothetical protein